MWQVYGKDQEYAERRLAGAQVHGTLALAAAAVGTSPAEDRAWVSLVPSSAAESRQLCVGGGMPLHGRLAAGRIEGGCGG
jgi:hypothetical protein